MVAPTAQRSRSGPRRITAGSYSTMILRLAIVWAAVAPSWPAGAMARQGSADIRRAEQPSKHDLDLFYTRRSGSGFEGFVPPVAPATLNRRALTADWAHARSA